MSTYRAYIVVQRGLEETALATFDAAYPEAKAAAARKASLLGILAGDRDRYVVVEREVQNTLLRRTLAV